jgi:glycosyltransferase involved in cell wall biosynthesis
MAAVRVAVTMEQSWHRVPGGTAVAALAVAKAIAASTDDDIEQIGVSAWHRHSAPRPWTPPIPVRRLPVPRLALYEAWTHRIPIPVELATKRIALTHATTIIPAATGAPLIVTIHDLAFVHDPSMFTAHGRRIFERSLAIIKRRADLVLCSSSATMDDCVAAGIDAARLRLVLLGVDDAPPATTDDIVAARARFGLHRPYLLFNGTLEPRKNVARLVAAFAQLAPTIEHDLVLAGPAGWGDAVSLPPALAARVRALGFVPIDELRALFAGADVCCQPSLREGFGLPVLQAMAQGTAVVTSRGTSTEEVAGGAAILVEPTDVDDIARGIVDALARRDELAVAGRRRAGELTWSATANATVAAYREVAR